MFSVAPVAPRLWWHDIYKKQSTMDFWWDETKDGRWWKVSDSSRSGLNGERKFLTCTGSYVCNNSTCSKLTSEGVKNHNHFIQAKGGGYTCHSCGYYVQKEYCGAMKILEFDIDTNYITIMETTYAGQSQTKNSNYSMQKMLLLTETCAKHQEN